MSKGVREEKEQEIVGEKKVGEGSRKGEEASRTGASDRVSEEERRQEGDGGWENERTKGGQEKGRKGKREKEQREREWRDKEGKEEGKKREKKGRRGGGQEDSLERG